MRSTYKAMANAKKYLFRYRNDRVGLVLAKLGLAARHKRIPIFGIHAAGKSYFIMSVAYFISTRKLGKVVGEGADYVTRILEVMMLGDPLDATQNYRDIDLEINSVYRAHYEQIGNGASWPTWQAPYMTKLTEIPERQESKENYGEQQKDSETILCDFLISTNDLSGRQFKDAVNRLAEPTQQLGGDPQTQRFLEVLEQGEGAIIVIDVVRQQMTTEEFSRDRLKHIRNALGEQLVALTRGIQLLIRKGNNRNKVFPLFLVFTKRDIHQLSRDELERIVNEAFAIQIQNLEERVQLRIHSVQNMGFGVDPESVIAFEAHTEGIGFFLADLYYWINQM